MAEPDEQPGAVERPGPVTPNAPSATTPAAGDIEYLSYAEFGTQFFAVAVTRERVVAAAETLTGRPIEVGPLSLGPLGLIKARAHGAVGEADVTPRTDEHVAFDVVIPAELTLQIEVGLDKYRFAGDLRIHLAVTARAAAPLKVVIDVEPPTRRAIEVVLRAEGLRASMLQLGGLIEAEIKRSVAKFVRREIEKPDVQRLRVIDVAAALDNLPLGRREPS